MKKAEREEIWDRVNAQAEEVFRDDESMRGFLNFMAQCTPQSTRNLLLLYEQDPSITQPRTSDRWKEAGRTVYGNAEGYLFFADQEYQRKDGTRGSGYVITKAYDISQTRGPRLIPPAKHLPEEIIAAMIEQSPVPLAISDQLPQGVEAQYVPKQRTIYVRNGMNETATICAIAREQAHAGFDTAGMGYYRQAYAAQAYCAAYVIGKRYGADVSGFQFGKIAEMQANGQKDPQELRGFLNDVRQAAYTIRNHMERNFGEQEQTFSKDDFSFEEPPKQTPKKEKKEKQPER